MTASLPDRARAFFDAPTFVSMVTVEPDGRPQASYVWARTDGDDVLVSTVKGRRKHRNLLRDPRVTLLVGEPGNPYAYAEVRGSVLLEDRDAPELIQELSRKYTGGPYTADGPDDERVVVRVRPERVVVHG